MEDSKDRKPAFHVDMREAPELFTILDKYRRNLGWTWKRTMLVGFANIISEHGDNPDLVVSIANYLENRR